MLHTCVHKLMWWREWKNLEFWWDLNNAEACMQVAGQVYLQYSLQWQGCPQAAQQFVRGRACIWHRRIKREPSIAAAALSPRCLLFRAPRQHKALESEAHAPFLPSALRCSTTKGSDPSKAKEETGVWMLRVCPPFFGHCSALWTCTVYT